MRWNACTNARGWSSVAGRIHDAVRILRLNSEDPDKSRAQTTLRRIVRIDRSSLLILEEALQLTGGGNNIQLTAGPGVPKEQGPGRNEQWRREDPSDLPIHIVREGSSA